MVVKTPLREALDLIDSIDGCHGCLGLSGSDEEHATYDRLVAIADRESALLAALDKVVEAAWFLSNPLREDFPDGGDIILRWPGNKADWEKVRAAIAAAREATDGK